MNNTLLIGNGILRARRDIALGDGDYSWADLLRDFATQTNIVIENIEQKPLPLIYEEIRIKSMARKQLAPDFSLNLSKLLNNIRGGPLCDIYSSISKNVLTTNYDQQISFGRGYEGVVGQLFPDLNERYHSLFRHQAYKKRNLWHIHGQQLHPKSILLGHAQYAKYMGQVKDYLYKGLKYSKHPEKFKSTLLSSNPDFKFDAKGKIYSWIDLFLRDHIHVIGFGMDFCESILWWLTIEKMALRIKHPKNVGGISYYSVNISNQDKNTKKQNILASLKDFGVDVIEVEANSYFEGYELIADILKPEIVQRSRNNDIVYIRQNI